MRTCQACAYGHQRPPALVCLRYPPVAAVLDGKALSLDVAVSPDRPACGEFKELQDCNVSRETVAKKQRRSKR